MSELEYKEAELRETYMDNAECLESLAEWKPYLLETPDGFFIGGARPV